MLDGLDGDTFVIDFGTSISQLVLKNLTPGRLYTFLLRQDDKGGHRLTWGNNIRNGVMLDATPHSVTAQCFIADTGGSLYAVPPGTWTEEGT